LNSRVKAMIRLLLILICAGMVVAIGVRQNSISNLRRENESLLPANDETQRLSAGRQEMTQLQTDHDEYAKLQKENADLPKLRNEVRQLRRDADDFSKLRAENERLTVAGKSGPARASSSPPPGFIPTAALVDVGLASPESTVQTFFAAMVRGDVKRAVQCLYASDGVEADLSGEDSLAKGFPGYRIASKKIISDAEIVIAIQTSAFGPEVPMTLKRVGNEWKLVEPK